MATSVGAGHAEIGVHTEQMQPSTDLRTIEQESTPSAPVEMTEIPPSTSQHKEQTTRPDNNVGAEQHMDPSDNQITPSNPDPSIPTVPTPTSPPTEEIDEKPTTSSSHIRQQSEALGPATDLPMTALSPPTPTLGGSNILSITLMLTTGARHPYKIDERYLRNRKVDATTASGDFDPREISGYQLKELIWTDWRTEWEPRPASPSAIRLIILGRLLEDKNALKDLPFKLQDTNVVHMTVKPADFFEDEDTTAAKIGKGQVVRGQDGEDRDAGCRCVIL